MSIPTVSIVIPARNQERYIGRCVRSALNQDFPEKGYEVIVVDDNSEDKTPYALQMFEEEIKIIKNSEQKGLPTSLNKAIKACRGRFVVRIDADDYVHRQYVRALSIHLKMNNYVDAVTCDYYVVNDDEEHIERKYWNADPIGCAVMFRVEKIIEVGLYDDEMELHEEKDLMIRFLEKYDIMNVSLPLYRYRKHQNNITNDSERVKEYMDRLEDKHNKEKIERMLN